MTAAMSQNSCESSFFIWILSTDEPKDFRRTVTISVYQFRCGSINVDFFQILTCKRLTDDSVQFLGLLFAGTLVGTDSIKCAVQGVILLDDLPDARRALSNDTPASSFLVRVDLVAATCFGPDHVENILVGFVGRREVECVVVVLHAPIITEPQAISSLGSDIFQIVCEARSRTECYPLLGQICSSI